jgi:two-component system OmpR family sensor kinase
MLGAAMLLAGLVAALASFVLAYSEAKELQDDTLRQIATLGAGAKVNSTSLNTRHQPINDKSMSDPESLISVVHPSADPRPVWLASNLQPGFHTVNAGVDRLRVFVLDSNVGDRTVVAQPTEVRDEIAINSALRTLIPLLLLLPILAWLVVSIVRRELAPITQLSTSLDQQSADRLKPIFDNGLPNEITPFVDGINRLLERVNHLMGQQRRFIADAAHELRSPLTALSIQAQNVRQAKSLPDVRERVISLQAGIERARQLTEQLLTLARTQAGTSGEIVVNVSMIARELIAEYLPLAESKRIDLGLDEVAPLSASTSPEVLRLILKNALENALNYTPAGGKVTVRLHVESDDMVIQVVDNGPGIPSSEREHVFDAFYRLPATAGSGSGLGLTIARESANRLGGNLCLHEGDEGHGLIFTYRQRRNYKNY